MKKILIVGLTVIGLVGTGWVFANNALATEEHQGHWQARQEQIAERLDEAVEDGVITADQKQTLLDKRAEMHEKHEQLREEMHQWMEESGIDHEALAAYRKGCGGHGSGKMHGLGGR